MPAPLVLLHGFGGTHRTWDAVRAHLPPERYRPVIALDLPGHGARSQQRPIDWDACVAAVLEQAPASPFVLAGYSLGGRVAQHVAVSAPERVRRLVLISTSPGLRDGARRAAADDVLADSIAAMSSAEFADRWMAQPVFAGTPVAARGPWRDDLMRNRPADLAVALRALTVGRMRTFTDSFLMPVTRIVGERDQRYRTLAGPDAIIIPGAGHGLPREAPAELAAVI